MNDFTALMQFLYCVFLLAHSIAIFNDCYIHLVTNFTFTKRDLIIICFQKDV